MRDRQCLWTYGPLVFVRLGVLGLGAVVACASSGPQFTLAPPPEGGLGQVYVYRTSDPLPRHDYGEVILVDGHDRGNVSSSLFPKVGCEYLWFNLEPGSHRLVASTKSHWFNLGSIPANPRELALNVEADRVYFVRVHRAEHGITMALSISWSTDAGFQSTSGPMMIQYGEHLQRSVGDPPPEIFECREANRE